MDSVLHKSTGDILELWNFLSSSRRKQSSKKASHIDDNLACNKRAGGEKQECEEEAERRRPLLVFRQRLQAEHHTEDSSIERVDGEKLRLAGKLFKDKHGKWLAWESESALKWSGEQSSLDEPSASQVKHFELASERDWNWSEPPIMRASASSCLGRGQKSHQSSIEARGGHRSLRRARRTKVAPVGRRMLALSTPALAVHHPTSSSHPPSCASSTVQINCWPTSCERIEQAVEQRSSDACDIHSNRLMPDSAPPGEGETDAACAGRHTLLDMEGLLLANQSHWQPCDSSFMPELAHQEATSGVGLECCHLSHVAAPANDNNHCDNVHSPDDQRHHSHGSRQRLPSAHSTSVHIHNESGPLTNDNGIDCEQQVAAVRTSGFGAADHETEQAPRSSTPATPGSRDSSPHPASTTTTTTTTHQQQPSMLAPQQQRPTPHQRDILQLYPVTSQRPSRAHTRRPLSQSSISQNNRLACSNDTKQQANDDRKKLKQQEEYARIQVNREQMLASESLAELHKGGEFLLRPLQCSSWLQALQSRHSGSYQVVQAARNQLRTSSISGPETANGHKQELEVTSSNTRPHPTESRVVQQNSRTGRSPVSLQRQTNARLARHMFRLQQQQELINVAQCQGEQQVPINSQRVVACTSYLQEGRKKQQPYSVPDRLSFTYSKSARQSRGSRAVRACESWPIAGRNKTTLANDNNRLENYTAHHSSTRNNQKYQVILQQTTNNPTRAIEICDNQPACSSRQSHQTAFLLSGSSERSQHRNQATHQHKNQSQRQVNVVVYNSVNMLRNVSQECLNSMSCSSAKEVASQTGCMRADVHDSGSIDSAATESTLSLNKPFCKICHMSSAKNGDKLISPCKCSGTMQYIHCGCLLKWLEISNRTNEKPICCELCSHEYSWHKQFNYKRMQFPTCSLKDFFLHVFFLIAIGFMMACVISPILQRRSAVQEASKLPMIGKQQEAVFGSQSGEPIQTQQMDGTTSGRGGKKPHQSVYAPHLHHSGFGTRPGHLPSGHLAQEEKLMLVCAAMFFISFFSAIYSQTVARDSLYGLFVKFLNMNRTYYITEYDHGQLNNNNSTCSANKQHHQQQQQTEGRSWLDRKFSSEEH